MGTGRFRLWLAVATLIVSSQAFALHSYTTKRSTSRKLGKRHVRRMRWNPMFRGRQDEGGEKWESAFDNEGSGSDTSNEENRG